MFWSSQLLSSSSYHSTYACVMLPPSKAGMDAEKQRRGASSTLQRCRHHQEGGELAQKPHLLLPGPVAAAAAAAALALVGWPGKMPARHRCFDRAALRFPLTSPLSSLPTQQLSILLEICLMTPSPPWPGPPGSRGDPQCHHLLKTCLPPTRSENPEPGLLPFQPRTTNGRAGPTTMASERASRC